MGAKEELCPRDKYIAECHRELLKDVKKVQCLLCYHWRYPFEVDSSGACDDCREEEDQAPYLWAQWRIDRGV